ncbi:thioredoxin [Allostreptomyces psammosilenae]|uniref:Thioredoxin n=1 Tax=Allostreptomyces psammosilenae TaxID=1892865 RepID=A0A852ZWA6_9ACTN|nr:thioredoxin [Allostreptomyces psammosilenae]NYI06499.1 putative thioredoxin [Allostreptomyces psammosilenae]
MQPRNMSMSGVVDLAAVKAASEAALQAEQARRARAAAPSSAQGVPLIVDVDESTFEAEVIQRSAEAPVVVDFWAEWCGPCKQLSPVLEKLANEYAGRFVLAKIDVDANQMLAQQFGIQGIPAVMAVVAGQLVPLFQGAVPEAQVRQYLDQLIQLAQDRFGLTGVTPGEPGEGGAAPAEQAPPRDPALEAAYDAMEAGDWGGAVQAFRNVLSDQPAHAEAKAGLAQAELLRRVADLEDAGAVRAAAAERPNDPDAQIAVADLDLVGGHVEDAFDRLVQTVARTAGEDRDKARLHLLELFEVVGPDDPRVTKARTALARVLF